MKKQTLCTLLTLCMTLPGAAWASANHGHSHDLKPLHGGVVAEVKDVTFELVAKADAIELHVRDHGKPVDTSKASAKVTFLTGNDKQEAQLTAANQKLEAKGTWRLAAGTKAVVQYSAGGKVQTMRFVLK